MVAIETMAWKATELPKDCKTRRVGMPPSRDILFNPHIEIKYAYMYTYVQIYMYLHMYAYMHIHLHMYMDVCIFISKEMTGRKLLLLLTVNAIMKATTAESQTAFSGTSHAFTVCHTLEKGMAPSLENAYAILQSKPDADQ
jgi:hypothetical protein